ncbi:MAG: DUF5691 domain-containing protein, partial [Acidimicrobiales bacterium]
MTSVVWDQLVSTALVGTERKPAPAAIDDVAAMVGTDLRADSAERKLLTAAGVLAVCRRAGFPVPPPAGAAAYPEPAAPDGRPPAPAPATQLLELVLSGQVTVAGGPVPLVTTWLEHCTASGHKVPGRLLPAILELGSRVRAVRDPALAAGGPALVWLAMWNERWKWAARPEALPAPDATADDTWRTGESAARMAALRQLREREPEQALGLVHETWAGETAPDRAAILAELAVGLGPHDEAFLEAALDDRAKTVRSAAAGLLASLPSSRLAAR